MRLCYLVTGAITLRTSSLTLHTRNPHILCIIHLSSNHVNELKMNFRKFLHSRDQAFTFQLRRMCCGYFSYAFWPPIRHNWAAIFISHQQLVLRSKWNVFESVSCEISMKICRWHRPLWTYQLSYLQWQFPGFIFSLHIYLLSPFAAKHIVALGQIVANLLIQRCECGASGAKGARK